MPAWGWTVLKWAVALVVMGVIVYISAPMAMDQIREAVRFGGDDDDPLLEPVETETEPEPAAPPETEEGTVHALSAIGARGGIVEDPSTEEVQVGPGAADELLIAFDALPTDPACLTGVVLEVQLLESTETSVYVQPARVPDLGALAAGASLPANWQVGEVEPSRAFTTGAPGGLRWDIQDVYSLAAREAEPGTNVALSVTTPAGDPDRATTFGTGVQIEERRPFIEWAAIAGCNGLGSPGTDPGAENGDEGDGDGEEDGQNG